jgi:carbonic anhydrase/acetyltransferase-like protein (isoleucine patch superfamily)
MKYEKITGGEDVFIAEGAQIYGDVELAPGCGVWFNATARGDEDKIRIGEDTNIQECAVLHVDKGFPLTIGKGVTVGHGAIIHGCTIGDNTVIGMGSILLNGAQVGKDCIIGAGSLVSGKTVVPDGWMAFGSPAKPVRALKPEEIEENRHSAAAYKARREKYRG